MIHFPPGFLFPGTRLVLPKERHHIEGKRLVRFQPKNECGNECTPGKQSKA